MQTELPIEILAVGTELLLGRIQDTNSFWMAERIAALGGELRRVSLLPDDLDTLVLAIRECIDRGTRVVIVCGGLGPTPDDLTVEAVARVAGCGTAPDEATLDDYIRRRNLKSRDEITPNLLKMATVPSTAQVFPNPAGWAPSSVVPVGPAHVIILPGPPRELEALFTLYVADWLGQRTANKSAAVRVTVNMHESEVSPLLQQVMANRPHLYLKAYVALRESFEQGLPVDVVASGASEEEAHRAVREAVAHFAELVAGQGRQIAFLDG